MIHSVRLQHVRLHSDSSYEFSDGVNVIVGPNASGKTTILEAINLACTGKPPGVKIKDMLSNDQDWMRVDVAEEKHQRTVKYESSKPRQKSFEIDDNKMGRLSHEYTAPVVWFDPEQLRLLRGSPSRRRDYIDTLLSQLHPAYSRHLSRYNRALLQRNTLLKSKNFTKDQIFVWNVRIAEHAKEIFDKRKEYVAELNKKLSDTYADLSGVKKNIKVEYDSTTGEDSYSETLLRQLEANQKRDEIMGHTSVGPHRDDIVFMDGTGRSLAGSSSRGEVRSMVLSLKIMELKMLASAFDKQPVLLFDDVFSELDGSRRHAFTSNLSGVQAIVTTTDADIVTKNFAQHAKIIAL